MDSFFTLSLGRWRGSGASGNVKILDIPGCSTCPDVGRSEGLASEPVTTAVTIALGTTVTVAVLRLIERWIEKQRQLETLKIVAEGFAASDEAGKELARIAKKHADVSIAYRLAEESWKQQATRS